MTGPPGERWMDAHCHLQDRYREGAEGVEELLREAWKAGVAGIVCVGTDVDSSRAAVAIAGRIGRGSSDAIGAWATAGVHPHEARDGTEELVRLLAEATGPPCPVVAVGECGLDYHYDHAPRDQQRRVFAEQVALAASHDLALVVHTREAWDDTLDILRTEGMPRRTVVHCFTGGPGEAQRCLDLGAYLSFSGIVTFRSADDVRAAARLCPADRLLVETDAPFLAPVPHRGKPNRPAWVAEVGRAVAAVRDEPVEALAACTAANTRTVFELDG